jgi:predicted GH43/DUF377 family glycosyl hydrolase
MGTVLDHQNKDMLLFEGKVNGKYYALTRPMGECYFATAPSSEWHPGAAIHLAASPDLLHWKPSDKPFLRARRGSSANVKLGGGTPPLLTDQGWLILYHGVENKSHVGCYRTYWALLDKNDPATLLHVADSLPLLSANPLLTAAIKHQIYLEEVVFSTGIVASGDDFIIASGELDLACRLTRINKKYFNPANHQLLNHSN